MKQRITQAWMITVSAFLILSLPKSGSAQDFSGTWNLDFGQSKHADFFDQRSIVLKISPMDGNRMTIEQTTTTEYAVSVGTTSIDLNGPETTSTWAQGDRPYYGYEAVAIGEDQSVQTKAVQGIDKSSFEATYTFHAVVSQGTYKVVMHSLYKLSPDGKTLTVTTTRDTREDGSSVVYVFQKVD